MMEGRYGGMGWDNDASPVGGLDLEENLEEIRREIREAGGSTAERAAGLSSERRTQAAQNLEEARRHFHQGLDTLNNLMYTLPPEQREVFQQSVMPLLEAAADKLQATKGAITPQ